MGVFKKNNKSPIDTAEAEVRSFFDDAFREELRSRARTYLDGIINENAKLFKDDLDQTITQVYSDLRQQLSRRIDEQFSEYSKGLKGAQDAALQSLDRSVKALHEQNRQLSEKVQKSITDQESIMLGVFEENKARMVAIKEAQDLTQQTLDSTVNDLKEQQQNIQQRLDNSIAQQEAVAIKAFEDNMAQVVEHYLIAALGEQYDVKAQLPSIIGQLEANKEAIIEDMKL